MAAICCDESGLMALEDALRHMLGAINPVVDTEILPLSEALERILAQPLVATINVPAYTNSAMDGYAVNTKDMTQERPLRLIGKALAGHPYAGEITPGTCIAITTGAPIPAGADGVVMQENTQRENDLIFIKRVPKTQENIRRQGEDIAAGDEVLSQGKRIGPLEIGLLASLGFSHVSVFRRLRVAVFSTGDELTAPGESLLPGRIYDSNRYGIVALLQRLAVDVIDLGLVPDQPAALRKVFQQASASDAIISSGGVSVGDADFVKDILREQGNIDLWKLAIKPGKPFAFGRLGHSVFLGLPGNPVSAMVTLHQLAVPVLQKMAGENAQPAATLQMQTATPFKKRPGRVDFQRAHFVSGAEGNQVSCHGAQGSGVLTSFCGANCYVVLERERGSVAIGEQVTVLPFDKYIGC